MKLLSASIGICLLVSLTVSGQNAQTATRPPDGGAREVLESIYIPPMPHAPFSFVLHTEWSRPMSGGGSFTVANQRRIMRDSAGRIYQERWILMPKGSNTKSSMNAIQVADPVNHILYVCHVQEKACALVSYNESPAPAPESVGSSGSVPDRIGFHTHAALGENEIQGFRTVGSRDVTTVNAGVFGSAQRLVTTREYWYSPELGINLLSMLNSSQTGKQCFTVTDLTTAEPERSYFTAPDGYKVIDQRSASTAQDDAHP